MNIREFICRRTARLAKADIACFSIDCPRKRQQFGLSFCFAGRKRGRQVTGQDRREITRECKLTLIPLDSFCTYAREPSNSLLCGRPCRHWYGFTSPITNRGIALASCFAFYLAVSSRYVDGEEPRSFLRVLFALNLRASIIELRVRSLY